MLFLEDLYSSKRTAAPDRRSFTGQPPKAPRRDPPPPPPGYRHIDENPVLLLERYDRAVSTKRTSIFSRRKSTATTSSAESQNRSSGGHSSSTTSSCSYQTDMSGVDNGGLKSKLFNFSSGSLYYGKRAGERKSDPPAGNDRDRNERIYPRRQHRRNASVDCKSYSSVLLAYLTCF